jgi:hypothetical protein
MNVSMRRYVASPTGGELDQQREAVHGTVIDHLDAAMAVETLLERHPPDQVVDGEVCSSRRARR